MPLFSITSASDSSRLAIWKITENPEDLVDAYPILSLAYNDVRLRFKSMQRQKEYLAIRALLILMSDGRLPEVNYDANGKPWLVDGRKVSFSHTYGYAAVLMSDNEEVGIDIEQRADRVAKVAHLFLREDEHPLVGGHVSGPSSASSMSLDALLVIWSAKETVYKLFSSQHLAFKEMKVHDFSPRKQGRIKVENLKTSVIVEVDYTLTDDYVLTSCCHPLSPTP